MLLSQISNELKQAKEQRRQPSLTRGIYWTAIGLFFMVMWFIRSYSRTGGFGSPEILGLVSAFLFLGIGLKEFVKYNSSVGLEDRGYENLPPADPPRFGSVLNLSLPPAERYNERVAPSTGQTSSVPHANVPSVTESTTRSLDVKHHETKHD